MYVKINFLQLRKNEAIYIYQRNSKTLPETLKSSRAHGAKLAAYNENDRSEIKRYATLS